MDTTWLTVTSFICSTLAIPTVIGLIWKDIHDKKKENSEEKKRKRKEEFQNNIREVIQEELKPLNDKIETMDQKIDLVADGTTSDLRNNIKDCFYRCHEKGYRNDYDFKNIHALYNSYHNLHGNSFIDDIMNRFDSLPPKEDFLKKKAEEEKSYNLKNMHTFNEGTEEEGGGASNGL